MSSPIIVTNSMNRSMRKLSKRENISLEYKNMNNFFDKVLYKKQRSIDKKCNKTARHNIGLRLKNNQE